jgi:hypothetical protein
MLLEPEQLPALTPGSEDILLLLTTQRSGYYTEYQLLDWLEIEDLLSFLDWVTGNHPTYIEGDEVESLREGILTEMHRFACGTRFTEVFQGDDLLVPAPLLYGYAILLDLIEHSIKE